MRGVLVFKDGSRVEMKPGEVGGIRFHRVTRGPNGEYLETLFESDAEVEGDAIVYREGETKDVSVDFAKARQSIADNTRRVIRRGLGFKN